jgi:metal-dependent amidase/aminoacylase/carboxypeptidase family protein
VHGIFTEAGDAANVVPKAAEAVWFVRSPTLRGLERLTGRVHACLRAGADAAGCDIEIEQQHHTFANMVDNPVLVDRYVHNAATVGRTVVEPHGPCTVVGSTDMGNVSQVVPAIHPMIQVSPPDVAIHTAAFADHAGSEAGDRAVLDGAAALALTIADCWSDPELVPASKAAFRDGADRIP